MDQTSYGFEWILVDDGSTDGTDELAVTFENDAFPFRYVRKENGGKHTALNASHPYIRGKYVLILDSDDTLTDDAVEQALEAWSRWESDAEVGIVTLLKGSDREHPNCYAADENKPVDIMAYRRICPVSSDACEVIRTELFIKLPFPVFEGEKFLSEGALWNRVSFTHKCVYVNRVIYLCSYLEGGLTRSGKSLRIRNPRGGMFTSNLNMAKKNGLKRRVKNGLLFTCYGCFAKLSPAEMVRSCDHPALMYCCLPFGWLMHLYWKMKY
jgi:glycosyltransferase involved in cell wall biosynthesis